MGCYGQFLEGKHEGKYAECRYPSLAGIYGSMNYKDFLIKMLGRLSEKSICRLCSLAEYLYVYVDGEGGAE